MNKKITLIFVILALCLTFTFATESESERRFGGIGRPSFGGRHFGRPHYGYGRGFYGRPYAYGRPYGYGVTPYTYPAYGYPVAASPYVYGTNCLPGDYACLGYYNTPVVGAPLVGGYYGRPYGYGRGFYGRRPFGRGIYGRRPFGGRRFGRHF
mmetsp:Transcript_56709/g.64989  ORF Transcript_56709/g.64989 Transcript_56709/m.64989 type:complete len:153 (+) Transcript_56709:40-498(+)